MRLSESGLDVHWFVLTAAAELLLTEYITYMFSPKSGLNIQSTLLGDQARRTALVSAGD